MTPSSPSPDTGAGTPLTAEDELIAALDDLLGRCVGAGMHGLIPDVLHIKTLAVRPAIDPAGLDAAVAQAISDLDGIVDQLDGGGCDVPTEITIIQNHLDAARLSVADGPGPEERP